MATSSISECSAGLTWNNAWRHPARPATTSPSFFPCRSLNTNYNKVSTRKTRYQLDTLLPGRDYFSLPSTPPQLEESIGKFMELKGHRIQTSQREKFTEQSHSAKQDPSGNRFLPEWYMEPCSNVLNLPNSLNEITTKPTEPLDHPQKREAYLLDSSYEDCDISDKSQYLDFEDCSIVNPSSGEVSKLNSLGQAQSRFLSLFCSMGNESSCSSSSSISRLDEQDIETSVAPVIDDVPSKNSGQDSDMSSGIEAVRKGLARLLSIPAESVLPNQQMEEISVEHELSPARENSGSRLIKLFPSSAQRPEEESDWEQDSPLEISHLWQSDSSLEGDPSQISSRISSIQNSPLNHSPENDVFSANSVKVPNITSISPTAPLHFTASPSFQVFEGFPNPMESAQTNAVNTPFYTACDLSNEETEIEAALERGDGFFTNDDTLCTETKQMDETIWSPSVSHACKNDFEDALVTKSIDSKALKDFAESAASDIIDWLDTWLDQCSNGFQSRLADDWTTISVTSNAEAEKTHNEEANIDATAMNFYAMFDASASDGSWQRIMSLGNEDDDDDLTDPKCHEEEVYTQLTQSPGILDFLVERENKEKEKVDDNSVQTQFPGSSVHFMLNSRASDIYDSYLLFPDLMNFTNPMRNDYRELDESSLFSQLFSSSFDWMGSLDVLDPVHQNVWDRTLQTLSPKTPFTPTGNLNDNLHSFERKHSITLEQLCNLATVASSMESVGLEHSSILSTDFFLQYLQTQLDCFENIAFFDSPSLKRELIEESSKNSYLNEDCAKLYRPVPLFPLQFINRLSLTSGEHEREKEQESLLFSPSTHFRPITPKPEEQLSDDPQCCTSDERVPRVEAQADDIDEELVAIHEGADHTKLVEIYAQMQLKQQLAAEQKQNYPQLVAVEGDGCVEEENAFEEKHAQPTAYESEVTDHALDCAAEAAATAAVNALGSAEPAEALAILEEWNWKEASDEESLMVKTFPDLGYFESAHDFSQSNDFLMKTSTHPSAQSVSLLTESNSATSTSWSIEDGSCIDQDFEYDSLKKIWIKTDSTNSDGDKSSYAAISEQVNQFDNNESFFLHQPNFIGYMGHPESQEIGLSPISASSMTLNIDDRFEMSQSQFDFDKVEVDEGVSDPFGSPSKALHDDVAKKFLATHIDQPHQSNRRMLKKADGPFRNSRQNFRPAGGKPAYFGQTEQDASWNSIWSNNTENDDGICIPNEPTASDKRDIALQDDCCTASHQDNDILFGYLKV